ncbi:tRNA-specific adenosine deaminase [Acinetobacter sp. TGL-Y2]|uniref:tRNA adenosine(34) deaminase TadA n=1 Tax=Acinetobacter sp. TGL-Y2 TaxID=1407071 RepID=UPI0007A6647D|nr:tRNA adenosine(34) deaminase TadA [Acinetobacter sp. TGL-Y2]AMW79117.1 tRNA-specific adenosine deaminase [Acinetobacter sp. TGL-Y2]
MTVVQSKNDEQWMQLAYAQAALAADIGEIPVGAVIVSQGQVIGQGFNSPISQQDPTAHAELVAIRQACLNIQNYRLPEDATLYVTLEPCTMCVGALIHSRIQRVVFAATEPKAGSLVSARQLLNNNGYYNHVFEFSAGCMQEQCSQQLSDFFRMRREQKKQLRLQQKKQNQPQNE